MQFLNPSILYFLGALIIPIIIHLFYFRRYKKVFFSDTRFLHEAKEVQRNASRLKHLLVLLSRLVAMALIILAFAQPFKSAVDNQVAEANHISFFIDNSFSMEAGGTQQNLLAEAKKIAIESVEAYPDHYSFHVFDHNFDGEDQQWIDKDKAKNKIRRTSLSGNVKSLSQIIGRQRQMQERLDDQPTNTYVFTDGQKNIFSSIPDFGEDERVQIVRLNPVIASNLSVDSVWLDDLVILPGQSSKLYVQLSNNGEADVSDVALSFTTDGQTRPAGSFDLPAGEKTIDTIPFSFSSSGWKELRLAVDDESIRFDDELLVTLPVSDKIQVLLINDNQHEAFYRAAIKGNARTTLDKKSVNNIVYSDFGKYDLIVVDGLNQVTSGLGTELNNYIRSGGNVLFFPGKNGDVSSYNRFLQTLDANTLGSAKNESLSVLNINTNSYIFKNVYRRTGKNLKTPQINSYYSLQNNAVAGREELLGLRNRAPYLVGYRREGGHFYLCTAPSDEQSSNILSSGSFFVPMLHRMSTSSKGGIAPYYTIGKNEAIVIPSNEKSNDPVYKLVGNTEVIPSRYQRLKNINLYAGEQIRQSGFFNLNTQDSTLAKLAFNFDRSESDMKALTDEEIASLDELHIQLIQSDENAEIAEAIVNKSQNTSYWRICIILALVFLLIEQLLLRHLKG